MEFLTDGKRHLICEPYGIENLHKMAEKLNIKKCWFHKNHYDIPKRRIKEIEELCTIISTKAMIKIIQNIDSMKLFLEFIKHHHPKFSKILDKYLFCQDLMCEDCLVFTKCFQSNTKNNNTLSIKEYQTIKLNYPELFI